MAILNSNMLSLTGHNLKVGKLKLMLFSPLPLCRSVGRSVGRSIRRLSPRVRWAIFDASASHLPVPPLPPLSGHHLRRIKSLVATCCGLHDRLPSRLACQWRAGGAAVASSRPPACFLSFKFTRETSWTSTERTRGDVSRHLYLHS